MVVVNVFLTPDKMGADTKIKFIRISDDQIGNNGGYFGFMQIINDEMVQC